MFEILILTRMIHYLRLEERPVVVDLKYVALLGPPPSPPGTNINCWKYFGWQLSAHATQTDLVYCMGYTANLV